MAVKSKVLIIFFIAMSLSVGAGNANTIAQNSSFISGVYFRAAMVTYSDFSSLLEKEKKDRSDLGKFLSDIKNYTVTVSQKNDRYFVVYEPNLFEGAPIMGGGAGYEVNKETFKIVKKTYFE